MKKWVRLAVFLAALGLSMGAAGYFLPIRGRIADQIFSKIASAYLKRQVSIKKISIRHFSDLEFESLVFFSDSNRPMVGAGFGKIYFAKSSLFEKRIQGRFTNIFLEDDLRTLFPKAFEPLSRVVRFPISLDQVNISMTRRGERNFIHVAKLVSGKFFVQGSLFTSSSDDKVLKFHLIARIPKSISSQIPPSILRYFEGQKGDYYRVRVTYGGRTVSIFGPRGPIVKLAWSPV